MLRIPSQGFLLWFNCPMFEIIHQDKSIIVINKPASLSVLPEGWDPDAPYLRQMLEDEYKQVWVVHRLDKITSGVMVFALTAEAHRELNRQFEQHEIEKTYQAIVEGVPPWDERTARHMLRTNVGRKHRTVVVHKRGKNSETEFRVLKRGQEHALIEAHPKTGRTHQVRVHLSAMGFPILGDLLYGAAETTRIARPALHAIELTFTHPSSGEKVTCSATFPSDFQHAMKELKP
jgi:23S rRNA pseudouridine955/2504/2580 synthase/23S rRNA pseudouridine1911/1915/1917 synthase